MSGGGDSGQNNLKKMRTKEKILVFITFLSTCLALALLTGSLASREWVVASAFRPSNPKSSSGTVSFGLFRGTRRLNHGFGERTYDMNVLEVQYRERNFMIRELYVATVACVCAAILFGLISAALSLFNSASSPVEAVCHYPGLIAFNVIAFLLSLAAIITWLVQYFLRLRANVLIREDIANGGWSSQDQAVVGYSFWLVFIAAVVYFANSVVFLLLQRRRNRTTAVKSQIFEAATKPNGNLMLY